MRRNKMTIATTERERPFPDQETPPTDYARGFRSGLETGMEVGHAGGRGYEQVLVQQTIEDFVAAAERAGDRAAADVLRNLAAKLPDPRRGLKRGVV